MNNLPESKPALISIIIPLYNCEKYIEEALDSAINQTYPNIEIIVINDASTDHSLQKAQKAAHTQSNIMILDSETNNGLCKTRNKGIKAASGDYIICLDADDVLNPLAVELLHNALSQQSEAIFAFGNTISIDRNSRVVKVNRELGTFMTKMRSRPGFHFSTGNIVGHGSGVLCKSNYVHKIGMFDENMRSEANEICGDWLFYIRLENEGKLAYLRDFLVGYRMHIGGMSRKSTLMSFYSYKYVVNTLQISSDIPVNYKNNLKKSTSLPMYLFRQALANKEMTASITIAIYMIRIQPIVALKKIRRSLLSYSCLSEPASQVNSTANDISLIETPIQDAWNSMGFTN